MTGETSTLSSSPSSVRSTEWSSRPKRSMKATWQDRPHQTWNKSQRFLHFLGVIPDTKTLPVPPQKKTGDPVPVYPELAQWCHFLPPAAAAPLIQYIWMKTTGSTWHPVFAYFFYVLSFMFFAIFQVRSFYRLGSKYGYFDSNIARDGIPDVQASKVVWSLVATVTMRPLFAFILAYNREELPSVSIWLPFQAGLYAVILDGYFAAYHGAMHRIPFLWKFHQRHHETHHPNPLLSPFADDEQDVFDIFVIPLLTYLTFPVNFTTWWFCTLGILYTEAMGHSGVRLYWPTPLTGWFLRPFSLELCLEDHDIHHRLGWRDRARNMGKQTRLWDWMAGTMGERIESKADHLDWKQKVPIWPPP